MIIRNLDIKDLENGFLEVMGEFGECKILVKHPERAKLLLTQKPSNHIILVAEHDNKIIGSATFYYIDKFCLDGDRVGYISDVAVKYEYRDQGFGSKLIKECIKLGKLYKCIKINLDCNDFNIKYYERFGFKVVSNYMRKLL